jgi:hypothetical protein
MIEAVYPTTGPAKLVLIGFDTGYNICRSLHKVLEFRTDGTRKISEDFGTCQEFADPSIDDEYDKTYGSPDNPHYANGEWKIGFPPQDGGPKLEWYVYSHGKVTKNGMPAFGL